MVVSAVRQRNVIELPDKKDGSGLFKRSTLIPDVYAQRWVTYRVWLPSVRNVICAPECEAHG